MHKIPPILLIHTDAIDAIGKANIRTALLYQNLLNANTKTTILVTAKSKMAQLLNDYGLACQTISQTGLLSNNFIFKLFLAWKIIKQCKKNCPYIVQCNTSAEIWSAKIARYFVPITIIYTQQTIHTISHQAVDLNIQLNTSELAQMLNFYEKIARRPVYIVPFRGYDTATFGTTEDELVFSRLKEALNLLGYECIYIYNAQIAKLSNDDFEYLILLNYTKTPKNHLLRLEKEKLVLMCFEPELVDAKNHNSSIHNLFGKVITCFDRFKGFKYHKFFYWPWVNTVLINKPHPFNERKLATLINGCKKNKHPDELYSKRTDVITFFEKSKFNDFEFYGHKWDSKKYKNYRGSIPTISGKRAILEKYRFCFCFENIKNIPGYISEKILDCLHSGCVPIYWGASNIDLYIPKNCYILREDFGSLQEIYDFIKSMPEEQYRQYLDNIKNYLSSDLAFLFSDANFVDSVLKPLFPYYDRTKVFNEQEVIALTKKDAWIAQNLKTT